MNEAMPPAPRSCCCRCFCHCAGDAPCRCRRFGRCPSDAPCTPHLTAARGCRKPAQRLHHSPDSGALSPIWNPVFTVACGRHSIAYLGIREYGKQSCGRKANPLKTPPLRAPALGAAPRAWRQARECCSPRWNERAPAAGHADVDTPVHLAAPGAPGLNPRHQPRCGCARGSPPGHLSACARGSPLGQLRACPRGSVPSHCCGGPASAAAALPSLWKQASTRELHQGATAILSLGHAAQENQYDSGASTTKTQVSTQR